MIMKYLNEKAKKDLEENLFEKRPAWVSETNSSFRAWSRVLVLKKIRVSYIKTHSKAADFVKKNNYQIKAAEVAKELKMNRSTLMHTSSYSKQFATFLEEVNLELELLKDNRVAKRSQASARGVIPSRKDELLDSNKMLKLKLAELERIKIEELVTRSLDRLPLPIKKKLGLLTGHEAGVAPTGLVVSVSKRK